MATYLYRCANGHEVEVEQPLGSEPLKSCQHFEETSTFTFDHEHASGGGNVCLGCDAPAERVMQPFGISFKGSGFYSTDYGRSR